MSKISTGFILLLCIFNSLGVWAASSPYAGQQGRAIAALSDADITAYLSGEGMGFAKAAELNGFPGPKHVLDLQNDLSLSPEQVRQTKQLFADMQQQAIDIGKRIVNKEQELNELFKSKKIDLPQLDTRLKELGTLQATLRLVHLSAHLRQTSILNAEQAKQYAVLRGYHDGMHKHQH